MATAITTDRFRTSAAGAEYAPAARQIVVKAVSDPPTIPWREAPQYFPRTGYFNAAEHRQLIADDLSAGKSVAIILTAVVGLGLLAMVATVLYTLL